MYNANDAARYCEIAVRQRKILRSAQDDGKAVILRPRRAEESYPLSPPPTPPTQTTPGRRACDMPIQRGADNENEDDEADSQLTAGPGADPDAAADAGAGGAGGQRHSG